MSALTKGTVAPEFRLPATPDQKVSLSDFRGRPVILVFYPADWSPVCGDQLALYNELSEEFKVSSDPHREGAVRQFGRPLAKASGAVILLHGRGGSAEDILTLASDLYLPQLVYLAPQAVGMLGGWDGSRRPVDLLSIFYARRSQDLAKYVKSRHT